jgi:ectoine hydroxylase-related dioxygenase (phytanoyl-CoA dioxygenase family)
MRKTFDRDQFIHDIGTEGSAILPGVLDPGFISRAKDELGKAIEKEAAYHGGTDYKDYGMVLLCALYGSAFIELLENSALLDPIEAILGEGCIVYAYTSSSMPPCGGNMSSRIHVDCPRLIPDFITNFGVTILLDDFTEDNGATWFLPRSQTRAEAPTPEEFYAQGKRVIAPAGSAWFFNARLWHAGGKNTTDRWRHALTLNMCRPFMKQRLDIPRAMSHLDTAGLPARARQKLGFDAQVPASYEEYYAPPERRKFKQKAE